MQNRLDATRIGYRYSSRLNPEVNEAHPLSNEIMEEPIPQNFVIPKITPFTGNSDPELHLKAFQARMLISGGADAIRCVNTQFCPGKKIIILFSQKIIKKRRK